MLNENQQPVIVYRKSNALGVLVGMLIGGLTGAVTMLLMAPQSGKETRRQIQEKGIELRDRTTEIVERRCNTGACGYEQIQCRWAREDKRNKTSRSGTGD